MNRIPRPRPAARFRAASAAEKPLQASGAINPGHALPARRAGIHSAKGAFAMASQMFGGWKPATSRKPMSRMKPPAASG